MDKSRIRVLFLCTGNSCRSQMAEGWAHALLADQIEAHSAGLVAKGLNPFAVQAMAEAGVDISGQTSKTLQAVQHLPFDYVITVCGHARETCPVWLAKGSAQLLHQGFDDPPELARFASSPEQAIIPYRRVRDEIRDFIRTLPTLLLRHH